MTKDKGLSEQQVSLIMPPHMDEALRKSLRPGARVRVTQQIAGRDYTWTSEIRGTVVEYRQKQTGSWYAHSKDDKLWLDRLTIRKDDGELTTLNLDDYTHIDLDAPAAAV
jgi:hypothetical protein